jgi:excisionase family DNA binding protein
LLDLLTISEAHQAARISRALLYRFLKDGSLPFVKLSNRTLIRRCDLDAFVTARLSRQDATTMHLSPIRRDDQDGRAQ